MCFTHSSLKLECSIASWTSATPYSDGTDEIDIKKLDLAIKEVLDQFDTPEVFLNNEDISEMITKSVMDYLDKNELKEVDDVTLVIKPNSNILEPKIKIDGNEEIKVGVLLPDDESETVKKTKRKIFVKKVHGTDKAFKIVSR